MRCDRLCIGACLLLSGCGRYADFALPAPSTPPQAAGFTFEAQPAPVLARGATGEWDSGDVLNPAVVKRDVHYYNFYSGFDGATWRTGLATSADGVVWQKQGKVLEPDRSTWEGSYIAANGCALLVGRRFWYWYVAGPKEAPRLGLARSEDGLHWNKEPAPILETGPRGSWDERAVADPYVIRAGRYFYLFYLGQDRARRQRLGLARSADGLRWEKLRTNPILPLGEDRSFDENGLGEPAVWQSHGAWWMLYTGRDRAESRRMGLARSTDGAAWQKMPVIFAGKETWDSQVICDAEIEQSAAGLRVWFGGGDAPRPDENLHGQIGAAVLRPVADATLAK